MPALLTRYPWPLMSRPLSDEQLAMRGKERGRQSFAPGRDLNEALNSAGFKAYDAEVAAFIDAFIERSEAYRSFEATFVKPQMDEMKKTIMRQMARAMA